MGIKDLHKLISEECPEQYIVFELQELCGMRIAVDMSSIIYRFVRSVDEWLEGLIGMFLKFKRLGINIICVFDGPRIPPEKVDVKVNRQKDLEKRISKLKQGEKVLEELKNGNDSYIDFLNQIKGGSSKIGLSTDEIHEFIQNFVDKAKIQSTSVSSEHYNTTKRVLKSIGIPHFQGEWEADGYCAHAAKTGIVDAVLTEDSDVLAYGCPLVLSFRSFKTGDNKLMGIHLPSLLRSLDFTHNQFVDLCILLSCDYNKRVKGIPPDGKKHKKPINIGYVYALCFIRHYKSLEESIKYIEDHNPLNIERCRKYFTDEYRLENIVTNTFSETEVEGIITEFKFKMDINYIKKCLEKVELIFQD